MTKTNETVSRRTILTGVLGALPVAAAALLAASQAQAGGDPDGKVIFNPREGQKPIKGRTPPQGKG
ncbi:MAG: hypothetical protein AAFW87_09065 [Pseudomonadota bacterium]